MLGGGETFVPATISVLAPANSDALAIVDAGLAEYNRIWIPPGTVQPLHVIATSEDGVTIGGAIGRTWGARCELRELWVTADSRGQREGTRLMDAFECEAAARGCEIVYLDTFSFQAAEFYRKRGYENVLEMAGFTDGVIRIIMEKRLEEGSSGQRSGPSRA
jgi:GNAT superfamily N-acetyltransferase